VPKCEGSWHAIAEEFNTKWQFPHCVGALDGKHVAILTPADSGSLYFNYKQFNSIVLLALVDANYRFLYVDIGSYGRVSDGGVFNNSSLGQALKNNSLNIPPPGSVTDTISLPFVVLADDAFALKPYMMKPYANRGLTREQRVFNYRLSRGRRVVENAFGILSQRFRVFSRAIPLKPEKVEVVTMAACCVHNFLLRDSTSAATYLADMTRNEEGKNNMHCDLQSVCQQGGNRCSANATDIRNLFCSYFNSPQGSVSWQEEYCFNT
jgi:hypothetical protein